MNGKITKLQGAEYLAPGTGSTVHRGTFNQFPFWFIYNYHSSKSTGKETDKMHLCAVVALAVA